MRIFEKTIELTLCSQISMATLSLTWPHVYFGADQPLWFGLTQKQEAMAGFDAATKLGNHRILILQFKAGKQLNSGKIKFTAPHKQMFSLQKRVKSQKRLVLYVLPGVTTTAGLNQRRWLLDSTWFLDVSDIPNLSEPVRVSKNHLLYLDMKNDEVEIRSDPVTVKAIRGSEFFENYSGRYFGALYDNFETLWKYASIIGKGAVAVAIGRQ